MTAYLGRVTLMDSPTFGTLKRSASRKGLPRTQPIGGGLGGGSGSSQTLCTILQSFFCVWYSYRLNDFGRPKPAVGLGHFELPALLI